MDEKDLKIPEWVHIEVPDIPYIDYSKVLVDDTYHNTSGWLDADNLSRAVSRTSQYSRFGDWGTELFVPKGLTEVVKEFIEKNIGLIQDNRWEDVVNKMNTCLETEDICNFYLSMREAGIAMPFTVELTSSNCKINWN